MKTYIFFISIFCLMTAFTCYAGVNYIPLTPIPGLTDVGQSTTQAAPDLTLYLKTLYKWGVAATSGLAVLVIMWGGVQYMTSAGGGGIEEAKNRIQNAIYGLLLALGSYIILQTINQDLTSLTFTLQPITVGEESGLVKLRDNSQDLVPTQSTGGSGPITSGVPQSNSSQSQGASQSRTRSVSPSSSNLPSGEPVLPQRPTQTSDVNPLLPAPSADAAAELNKLNTQN